MLTLEELHTTEIEVLRVALTNYILDDYGAINNRAAEELLRRLADNEDA